VDEAWVVKLPAPTNEELEMLDGAFQVDERSRLCCQIIMAPELEGLELELAPESLADAPPARLAVGT
jgi:2Fe-2S ferredoxin